MRLTLTVAAALAATACSTGAAHSADSTATTASATTGAAATNASADVSSIRKSIDSSNAVFVKAITSNDTSGVASNYAPDAVVLPDGAPVAHGHDEIVKLFGGLMSAMRVTGMHLNTTDLIPSGNYVIETGTYDMNMQPAKGKAVADTGKYVTVWERQPGGAYKLVRDIWNSNRAPAS